MATGEVIAVEPQARLTLSLNELRYLYALTGQSSTENDKSLGISEGEYDSLTDVMGTLLIQMGW